MRVLHWTLVFGVTAALITTQKWARWHETVGYAVLGIAVARLLWGLPWRHAGSRYARFAQFLHSPRATLFYFSLWRRHREPRHVGHNPLGGWMVVLLLGWVLAITLSGWLYTTDRYWGDDTVSTIHQWLGWSLLVLIALHLTGVACASLRHRENLVRSMIDGRKREPRRRDVA